MKRERAYVCFFHCGEQPTQEILFWSRYRKGSMGNKEDALGDDLEAKRRSRVPICRHRRYMEVCR